MSENLFQAIYEYFLDVYRGLRSMVTALMAAIPYLINVRSGDLKKEVTEQYPDPVSSRVADELPARTRGILFNDIDKCTGCRDCERACPVKCISIETEPGPLQGKHWVSVFDIDLARCTSCGLCAEVCLPNSLVHTKRFESSVGLLSELVSSFGRGRVTPEQRNKWAQKRMAQDTEETL